MIRRYFHRRLLWLRYWWSRLIRDGVQYGKPLEGEGVFCDSCGSLVATTYRLYKPREIYDAGFAHGIGFCCVPNFKKADYVVLNEEPT